MPNKTSKRPLFRAVKESTFYLFSFPGLQPKNWTNSGVQLPGYYIVSTGCGLFRLAPDGSATCLIEGEFYGISVTMESIYVFQNCGRKGRILVLSNTVNEYEMQARVLLNNLSPGCHQIDIIDDTLYVCDTYNNAILTINIKNGRVIDQVYPLGKLLNGRSSANYAHINSIFLTHDRIIIFCHNESLKTGRKSTIVELDTEFQILRTLTTQAHCGHNCVVFNNDYLYCDSVGKRLMLGDKVLFQADLFTRGIAITDSHLLLGGTEMSKNRALRNSSSGTVYLLNRGDYRCQSTITLPGKVQEIRRLYDVDLGLSVNQYHN